METINNLLLTLIIFAYINIILRVLIFVIALIIKIIAYICGSLFAYKSKHPRNDLQSQRQSPVLKWVMELDNPKMLIFDFNIHDKQAKRISIVNDIVELVYADDGELLKMKVHGLHGSLEEMVTAVPQELQPFIKVYLSEKTR